MNNERAELIEQLQQAKAAANRTNSRRLGVLLEKAASLLAADTKKDAALDAALEALEESVDLVRHDYESDWRHGIPTRKAQLDGKKEILDAHIAAITKIKEAR